MTEKCGAENRNGEPCSLSAGWGTNHSGEGRCKFHGGAASGGAREGSGAPEGNGNAETHGLQSDAEKWFERHRDEVSDRVRQKVARAVEHVPFGWENLMKMDELVQAAINQEQVRKGDQYIDNIGIMRTETIPVGDSPVQRTIEKDEENPASLQKSRLQKDTIRLLKELGYLDDPDSQQAESMQSIAEILSEEE